MILKDNKAPYLFRHSLLKVMLCALGAVISITVIAQDVHFSQYFNNPLSLNPALTGKVDGTFRIGVDYRNQWSGLGSRKPYSTPSFYGDVPIRFKSKDILGVGLNIINDKSSGGLLTSFSGLVSTAFHKAMGNTKNHFFSFGLQFGFLQKRLDRVNIKLGDQADLSGNSVDLNDLKGSDGGFDMNSGFDWSSRFSDRAAIHMGYAAFHITQPGIAFFSDDESLPVRHSFSFESDFGLAKHFRLQPLLYYISQAKSHQTYLGLSLGFPFSNRTGMYLGSYFRLQGAAIPYFGLDIKGFKLGVSYDITTSSLDNTGGGIEISIIYIGRYIPVPDVVPSLYCPRF